MFQNNTAFNQVVDAAGQLKLGKRLIDEAVSAHKAGDADVEAKLTHAVWGVELLDWLAKNDVGSLVGTFAWNGEDDKGRLSKDATIVASSFLTGRMTCWRPFNRKGAENTLLPTRDGWVLRTEENGVVKTRKATGEDFLSAPKFQVNNLGYGYKVFRKSQEIRAFWHNADLTGTAVEFPAVPAADEPRGKQHNHRPRHKQ